MAESFDDSLTGRPRKRRAPKLDQLPALAGYSDFYRNIVQLHGSKQFFKPGHNLPAEMLGHFRVPRSRDGCNRRTIEYKPAAAWCLFQYSSTFVIDEHELKSFFAFDKILDNQRIIKFKEGRRIISASKKPRACGHRGPHCKKRGTKMIRNTSFLPPIINAGTRMRTIEELKQHLLRHPGFSNTVCKSAGKRLFACRLQNVGKPRSWKKNQPGGKHDISLPLSVVPHRCPDPQVRYEPGAAVEQRGNRNGIISHRILSGRRESEGTGKQRPHGSFFQALPCHCFRHARFPARRPGRSAASPDARRSCSFACGSNFREFQSVSRHNRRL